MRSKQPARRSEVVDMVMLTAQLGSAILTEAALSYLGLGVAEPTPSWG
jgi:peptide/nickel transport system permease protein